MIELLRARNVIRSAGARQLPLPNGNLTMPRQTGAATANYTGESTSVQATQGTLDQITLVAKKLMAITAVSNELMRTADPSADRFVRDDLLATAANREDLAFIRGDGTQNTPRGLRYAAASVSAAATSGSTLLANMLLTTQDLFTQLANSNIAMERPAFFLSPRSYYALMFARDASGDGLLLREEIANGSLFGVPLFTTTQIPVNLGGGSDSEMYLADMNQVVIGDALNPVVEIFDGAAYHSGSSVVSGVSRDETVVRMKQEHDIVVRHPEAVAVKTGVQF
jgi:HK97 family phage major capsid protein